MSHSKSDLDQLHLGCGLRSPPGWINVDGSWQVVLSRHPWLKQLLIKAYVLPARHADAAWGKEILRWNLTRPLPFRSGQFKAVYSSHTLEHLHYDDASRLMSECLRVLRPGGICRMVVPDLRALIDSYLKASDSSDENAAEELMARLNTHPRTTRRGLLGLYQRLTAYHTHKWMYDSASLAALFRRVGFCNVEARRYLDSALEHVDEVEDPGRLLNGEGIAVEGRKPDLSRASSAGE